MNDPEEGQEEYRGFKQRLGPRLDRAVRNCGERNHGYQTIENHGLKLRDTAAAPIARRGRGFADGRLIRRSVQNSF